MGDNYPEAVAKRVLEMAIPGARMVFRPQQSHGEYDFDLYYPNGEAAAVEVTSSRHQALTQIYAEIFCKKSGDLIPALKCKKAWFISPAIDAYIPKVRRNADDCLASLEAAGIEYFDLFDCWRHDCPANIANICVELNLTRGAVISSSGPPQIRMGGVVGGGAVGQASATEAAEREIGPNKNKLGRAGTKERHLVVYVDQLNGQPFTALTSFPPPPEFPELPAEVTHIWLVTEVRRDQFVVWYGSSTEHWRAVELPVAS